MKIKAILICFVCSLVPPIALAGSGHDHGHGKGHSHSHAPVTAEVASAKAEKIVATLVRRNVIDQSWMGKTANSSDKKTFKGNQEWVVVFVNDTIADADKRRLYIFLTLSGDYIAANYTGK